MSGTRYRLRWLEPGNEHLRCTGITETPSSPNHGQRCAKRATSGDRCCWHPRTPETYPRRTFDGLLKCSPPPLCPRTRLGRYWVWTWWPPRLNPGEQAQCDPPRAPPPFPYLGRAVRSAPLLAALALMAATARPELDSE